MTIAAPSTLDLSAALEQRVTGMWWRLSREAYSDLSRTAASVLATLREDGPQRITALAAHEQVTQPTMSLLAQRLGRRGLVERTEDPDDRRACRITITAAGEQLLCDRADARARWLGERLQRLGEPERATILEAVRLMDVLLAGEDGE